MYFSVRSRDLGPVSELTAVPARLDAGSAYTIRRTLEDYPASDGWAITLDMQGRSALHIDSAPDVDDHVISLTAILTAALLDGRYQCTEKVSRTVDGNLEGPFPVRRFFCRVRPDLATATAGSLEDPDEKALRIVTAVRDGRLAVDVAAYQLEGTGVTREALMDTIEALYEKYRHRVHRKNHPGLFASKAVMTTRRSSSAGSNP
jgi:hypothetical protein